jgi:hypothetical protein
MRNEVGKEVGMRFKSPWIEKKWRERKLKGSKSTLQKFFHYFCAVMSGLFL